MKSAEIHLLNYLSFRSTQLFLFLDKFTGPIMPFVPLALYTIFCRKENDKKIPNFTFPIDSDYKNSLVLFTYLY